MGIRALLMELPAAVQAFLWSSWEVPWAPAEARSEDPGYSHCAGKPHGLHGSTVVLPDGKDLLAQPPAGVQRCASIQRPRLWCCTSAWHPA